MRRKKNRPQFIVFRRGVALLLACLALLTIPVSGFAQETAIAQTTGAPEVLTRHKITGRRYNVYLGDTRKTTPDLFTLYFLDGVDDLPYVELKSWVNMLLYLNRSMRKDSGYKLNLTAEGSHVLLLRENETSLELDFDNELMIFEDYDDFVRKSGDSALIDLLSQSGLNDSGESSLFKRNWRASFERYGAMMVVDLGEYGIDLVQQDGKYYIPLQTMNDFFISLPMQSNFLFNGNALFYANDRLFYDYAKGEYTDYAELYYSAKKGNRSAALADFSYNELCLALDTFYGLKDSHDIDSFHHLFWQIDYAAYLSGASAWDADITLKNFINFQLDDLHSVFTEYSWMAGKRNIPENNGMANKQMAAHKATYKEARAKAYSRGVPGYEEVGDTAFITFDTFTSLYSPESFYGAKDLSVMTGDTIGLILYAHSRIMRSGSPVKNVVFDLSNNSGGSVDAALFMLGWVMGEAPLSIQNTASGAMSTAIYRADVNLDRMFNAKDTLEGKKVYCLISPVTFSCGNTVAAALKSSQAATIVGRTSGGGSCVVQPLSTAHGTMFQISSAYRMSFLKNGAFYDIDPGVDPDYYLNDIAHFYDRRALTKYLKSLF